MANLWLKIKVWTKILLFSALALYVLLFLYQNSGQKVFVWLFFGQNIERSTLWLAVTAFAAGAVTVIVTRTLLVTVRQLREIREHRQKQQFDRDVADMHAKAAMLQTKTSAGTKPDDSKSPES